MDKPATYLQPKGLGGQKHVVSKADEALVSGARGRSGKSCMAKTTLSEAQSRRKRGSPQEKRLTPVSDVAENGTTSLQSFHRSLPVRNGKRRKGRLEHELKFLEQLGDHLQPVKATVTEEP